MTLLLILALFAVLEALAHHGAIRPERWIEI